MAHYYDSFLIVGVIAAMFTASHSKVVESLVIIAGAGVLRKSEGGWWDSLILDEGLGFEDLSRRKIMNFINGNNHRVKPDWKEQLLKGEVDTALIEKWGERCTRVILQAL